MGVVPECVISQMRLLVMPAMTYFLVSSKPTPFADLDKELDRESDGFGLIAMCPTRACN